MKWGNGYILKKREVNLEFHYIAQGPYRCQTPDCATLCSVQTFRTAMILHSWAGLRTSHVSPMAPIWALWRTITSSSLYFGVHLNWVEFSLPFSFTQETRALRMYLIKGMVRPWCGIVDREKCRAHQSWVLVPAYLVVWPGTPNLCETQFLHLWHGIIHLVHRVIVKVK